MESQLFNGSLIEGPDETQHNESQVVKLINGSTQVPFKIAIKEQAVTEQRPPYVPQHGDRLVEPGTARANLAPSKESPYGTTEDDYAKRHQDQTVR